MQYASHAVEHQVYPICDEWFDGKPASLIVRRMDVMDDLPHVLCVDGGGTFRRAGGS